MTRLEFKAARLALGLSQQKFGERLFFAAKWARQHVSDIERGARPLSRRTEKICEEILKRRGKRR